MPLCREKELASDQDGVQRRRGEKFDERRLVNIESPTLLINSAEMKCPVAFRARIRPMIGMLGCIDFE